METVLEINESGYVVKVIRKKLPNVYQKKINNETGLVWSVWKDKKIVICSALIMKEPYYTAKQAARNGIKYIADLEPTLQKRYEKTEELIKKHNLF